VILYYSGHGMYKSEPLLCSQDAQLPSATQSVQNLIAPQKTIYNMQSRQPSIQCFFVDACAEINLDVLQNVMELPAAPLYDVTNARFIDDRDGCIFYAAPPGRKAYGPENDAPYFTQELLRCLENVAGDSATSFQEVTSNSLRQALVAAGCYR